MSTDRDLERADIEPSEFLRKRRHKSVNDLREAVYRARMRAYDARRQGYSENTKDDIIRAAVENYITELEPLLVNTEKGKPYWEKAELGAVVIHPPNDGRQYREEGYEQPLVGLVEFQNAPERFAADFTFETEDMVHGTQQQVVLQEVGVPEHISWTAFRYANQFAYEIGLDIDHKEEIAVEADPF